MPVVKGVYYTEEAYLNSLHTYCPECGSANIESTTIGFSSWKTYDGYTVGCHDCGWKGIYNDLVSACVAKTVQMPDRESTLNNNTVDIELSKEAIAELALQAHERGITLNDYIVQIVAEYCAK